MGEGGEGKQKTKGKETGRWKGDGNESTGEAKEHKKRREKTKKNNNRRTEEQGERDPEVRRGGYGTTRKGEYCVEEGGEGNER